MISCNKATQTTRIFYYSIGNCALLSFNFVFRFICGKCECESMLMGFLLYKCYILWARIQQNKAKKVYSLPESFPKNQMRWVNENFIDPHQNIRTHIYRSAWFVAGKSIARIHLPISNGNVFMCSTVQITMWNILHAWNMYADEHAAFILILWRRSNILLWLRKCNGGNLYLEVNY